MDYLYNDGHARPHIFDSRRTGAEVDAFTTTSSYEVVYEWVTKYMGKKFFRISAGTYPVTFRVLGSYDGYNYDYTAVAETTIAGGQVGKLEVDAFFASLKIEAKDGISGSHSEVEVVLTATSQITAPNDGSSSIGKIFNTSHMSASDAYEVMGTYVVAGFIGVSNTISVTGYDSYFKFEYSKDGVNWLTSIEDYPIAAGATAVLTAIRSAYMYRVSMKPQVSGQYGTASWILVVSSVTVDPEFRTAFAYEDITVSSTPAIGFTIATMADATRADLTVENNPIRVRWDGGLPTASVGHLLEDGDVLRLDLSANCYHFRAIATAGDAILHVTYSR